MTRSALAMLFASAVVIAACGSAAPTAVPTPLGGTPTGAATATGGTTATPTPAATGTPGATNQPVSNICAAFPTVNPANPLSFPSPVPDPGLEAHFPAQIDGSNASDVQSGSFAAFVCLGGGQGLQQLQNSVGYDLSKLTWGQADYTVDDNDVELIAFRTPGGDANQVVGTLAQLIVAVGGQASIENVTQGTVGGKNVYIVTNDDGTKGYGYVSGDTLVTVDDATDSQANKILSALQ